MSNYNSTDNERNKTAPSVPIDDQYPKLEDLKIIVRNPKILDRIKYMTTRPQLRNLKSEYGYFIIENESIDEKGNNILLIRPVRYSFKNRHLIFKSDFNTTEVSSLFKGGMFGDFDVFDEFGIFDEFYKKMNNHFDIEYQTTLDINGQKFKNDHNFNEGILLANDYFDLKLNIKYNDGNIRWIVGQFSTEYYYSVENLERGRYLRLKRRMFSEFVKMPPVYVPIKLDSGLDNEKLILGFLSAFKWAKIPIDQWDKYIKRVVEGSIDEINGQFVEKFVDKSLLINL